MVLGSLKLIYNEQGFFTFDVYANLSPFIPAKIGGRVEDDYPAEGGEITNVYAVLEKAEICKEDIIITLDQLTWLEKAKIAEDFASEVYVNDRLYENLLEKLQNV